MPVSSELRVSGTRVRFRTKEDEGCENDEACQVNDRVPPERRPNDGVEGGPLTASVDVADHNEDVETAEHEGRSEAKAWSHWSVTQYEDKW